MQVISISKKVTAILSNEQKKGAENMGRTPTAKLVDDRLNSLMRIGESRHKAKEEVREQYRKENGGKNPPATAVIVPTIHSIQTRKVYGEHCHNFIEWCQDNGKGGKYATLERLQPFAVEYLEAKEAEGLSAYSLASMRSALAKLYGEQIDYKAPPALANNIRKSRETAKRDARFSEARNADLVTVAKATGGRRSDLAKLKKENFIELDGRLWVVFHQSKGGKDRIAPVLPKHEKAVRELLERSEGKLFEKIHDAADIHAYRREYCHDLYKLLNRDKKARKAIEREYPVRTETNIKSPYYITDTGEKFYRDYVFLCSQALGHNRLNVTVLHYLKS